MPINNYDEITVEHLILVVNNVEITIMITSAFPFCYDYTKIVTHLCSGQQWLKVVNIADHPMHDFYQECYKKEKNSYSVPQRAEHFCLTEEVYKSEW